MILSIIFQLLALFGILALLALVIKAMGRLEPPMIFIIMFLGFALAPPFLRWIGLPE
jgi:hypothetical protein